MNKKRRRAIYTSALNRLREQRHNDLRMKSSIPYKLRYSMCVVIGIPYLLGKGSGVIMTQENWDLFPEFLLFQPDTTVANGHWLDPTDYDTRETILLMCIEMTK